MDFKKKVQETIYKNFSEENLDLSGWYGVLNSTNSIPSIYHLLSKVEYYVAILSQYESINLSIVLQENKRTVGLMPLMAHRNLSNQWILSSNGIEIVEPIFEKNIGNKLKKKFEKKLLETIFDLSNDLKINKCKFVNMELFKLSDWYINLLDIAEETCVTHHLLVDLSLNIEEIKSNFRKSFKHCINQGLREWKVEVHDKISKDKFDEFRLLHKTVSKKTTRPIESWNIQKKEIDDGLSFLITVSDLNNTLVGAGLFNCSKNLGNYESGVYKRELFDKPLAHPVQMKAIETLKNKGFQWYELGQKFFKVDKNPPSEKELSVSYFKEGFATDVIARQHLIVNMNK